MLHRLSLRVIPQLSAAVTESAVRKRKRLVMVVPGLVAFGVYRLLKLVVPLADPWELLGLSGLVSALAALWAFRMGRRESIAHILSEESPRYVAWIVGWVGCAYGVQLSLLVLALLAIFVQYDFLAHPDGPAMMALIIPSTAVTRDAFELGHVRRLAHEGLQIVTNPDGATFRRYVWTTPRPLVQWVLMTWLAAMSVSWAFSLFPVWDSTPVFQVLIVSAVVGLFAHAAFLAGQAPNQTWGERTHRLTLWKNFQFWIWPCFTFAMTYYLVAAGLVMFLLRLPISQPLPQFLVIGSASVLMAVYFYYLGTRVLLEVQARGEISEGLRRCPFVMDILTKTGWASPTESSPPAAFGASQSK